MPFLGIIWATIICIPFWLFVIFIVKAGIMSIKTLIFAGLVLSGLLLILVLTSIRGKRQDEKDQHLFRPSIEVRPFCDMKMEFKMADNGGTRTGIDRRSFEYTAFIPEQRSGMDRRSGFDRRRIVAPKIGVERRSILITP